MQIKAPSGLRDLTMQAGRASQGDDHAIGAERCMASRQDDGWGLRARRSPEFKSEAELQWWWRGR